jgi:predicted enzyme related to lactoylglutathione lyase
MSEDWARPVVHWEIYAKDVAKMRDFYRGMFNWKESMQMLGIMPLLPTPRPPCRDTIA